MNELTDMLFHSDMGWTTAGPMTLLLVVLLAFVLGQVIGWIYMWTHLGLSYSRMFVASLVVMPPIVALVMVLMSGNIVIAFGLLAVFAVVRFRNVLKDTRDTVFVLWAITVGLAAGTMRLSTAVLGCAAIGVILLYLRLTLFGSRHRYDAVLSLHWDGSDALGELLKTVLRRHSARAQLASQREGGEQGMDVSYNLLLRDPAKGPELLRELKGLSGVGDISLYMREDESEM